MKFLKNLGHGFESYISQLVCIFFLWKTCHKSLPTRSILCHQRVFLTSTCPFRNEDETISHCLMLCPR